MGMPGRRWELTVNVLVLSRDHSRVLLARRTKEPLVGWRLPPGGHVEPGERPDEAARREVQEETGVAVALVDARPDLPPRLDDTARRVTQPHHIQLEPIDARHDHLDLVYIAYPVADDGLPAAAEAEWVRVEDMLADEFVPANVKVTARAWLAAGGRQPGVPGRRTSCRRERQ